MTVYAISLGAGVQSSTMALMFAAGEFEPMPDCAIFADTGAEPAAVYTWLDWLEQQLPFPVHRVMEGDGLQSNIVESIAGGRFAGAPFYTDGGGQREGQLRRQCTREFKVQPINRKLRELVGLAKGQRAPRGETLAIQYIGISLDEAQRMKPAREAWIDHRWPLVEAGIRRWDCQQWLLKRYGFQAPRSACTFCPYHSNAEWRDLKVNQPADFEAAAEIDDMIRAGVRGTSEQLFLHRSCVPLREIDFASAEDIGQGVLEFGEECEGMCGV